MFWTTNRRLRSKTISKENKDVSSVPIIFMCLLWQWVEKEIQGYESPRQNFHWRRHWIKTSYPVILLIRHWQCSILRTTSSYDQYSMTEIAEGVPVRP